MKKALLSITLAAAALAAAGAAAWAQSGSTRL
jgi:hypothetical protein